MKQTHTTKQAGLSTKATIAGVAVAAVVIALFFAAQNDGQIDTSETSAQRVPAAGEYLRTQAELDAEENVAQNPITAPIADAQAAVEATEDATAQRTAPVATAPTITTQSNTADSYVKYDESLLTSGTNIIFFHATWCPSCRALEKDLTNNITDIPSDITILKADYDTETDLKLKYGVNRQHTLVVVDADGNEVKKLTGLTNTLDQVLNQI